MRSSFLCYGKLWAYRLEVLFPRNMGDIGKSWPVLLVCGEIVSLALSVIWLLLIRYIVAAMPWITVALFNILIVSVTIVYYLKGQELSFVHHICI